MPAAPMQPWLNHYPPGVPATVDASAYPSLVALLDEAWHRHASRDASACMGSRLRFRDVDELSHALAAWLQAASRS
jgi:long-chain acyl-CoA synthetase